MANKEHKVMTVRGLIDTLNILLLKKQINNDWKINLSSDEEGNSFQPMLADIQCSLGVDKEIKTLIFYPSHI